MMSTGYRLLSTRRAARASPLARLSAASPAAAPAHVLHSHKTISYKELAPRERKFIFSTRRLYSSLAFHRGSPCAPRLVQRALMATTTSSSATTAAAIGSDDASSAHPTRPDFENEFRTKKHFDHAIMERDMYLWWEKNGCFKPPAETTSNNITDNNTTSNGQNKTFVIPMPPPNVTGYLHMGHALFVAIQDIFSRFHRMLGHATLWLPGTDHAGIATQMLVEKQLAEKGIKRADMGRDAFIDQVWAWKREKGGRITEQLRRLGASADWSREKFTLDPDLSEAVTEAFVRLHEKGLVYKGNYIVNWSPALQTALSDLEVDYNEEDGCLYYFKYHVAPEHRVGSGSGSGSGSDKGGVDYIPVATTRPETVFGDSAVCVHPEDPRFAHLIGKHVVVPTTDRRIPVIADTYVDREFGTGALKITPGHDVNDFAIGQRHSLPVVNVMNKDGTMNEVAGKRYAGMDRFECRKKLWEDLQVAGATIRADTSIKQRVPRSQRSGEIVEPLVSEQWFVKTKTMNDRAMVSVSEGHLQIIPQRFEKTWYSWLSVERDWCVSRQLWWGHRIPAYYPVVRQQQPGAAGPPSRVASEYFVARSKEEAIRQAREKYGDALVRVERDEDVLDTWFSSGLWPFATVGWPRSEASAPAVNSSLDDFRRFFPATLLETGYDILFFWVARMVMLSQELTGELPFRTVYLHGLVRDEHGQKMSKTKGNVIDPLTSISEHGCDALRLALVTGTPSTPGQDAGLSQTRIESCRHFVTKLWNVGKYIDHVSTSRRLNESFSGSASAAPSAPLRFSSHAEVSALALPERYIVSKMHKLARKLTTELSEYGFSDGSRDLYEFVWSEFADWFIEASKTRLKQELVQGSSSDSTTSSKGGSEPSAEVSLAVLNYVWEMSLRLMHPYIPFVTEALWQNLPASVRTNGIRSDSQHSSAAASIMLAQWPVMESTGAEELFVDESALESFVALQDIIKAVRNTRAEYNVPPSKRVGAVILVSSAAASSADLRRELERERGCFALLARLSLDGIRFVSSESEIDLSGAVRYVELVVREGIKVYMPLADLVDTEKEIARLRKQREAAQKDLASQEARLGSSGFRARAKPEVVAAADAAVVEKRSLIATIQTSLDKLTGSK